jgi:serine/threonine protein kinase
MVAQLSHPNIITVYRRGATDDGLLWIAMEYVEGTDAQTMLGQGLMTPARAVHIVSEIAKALDYAHQNGVIHRDVKPANFLLSTDAHGDERVLLADFGIAHSLDDGQPPPTGSVLATVAYAAPEVFNGAPVGGRADLYSLGCSLFRLLTGRKPFPSQGETSAVIKGHLYDTPPKVTDFAPDLPVALNDVIATALAKDPVDRFQSGGDLAAAAARALRQRRPTPPPPRLSSTRDDRAGQLAPLIAPMFDAAAFAALSARARRRQDRQRRIVLVCALLAFVTTLTGLAFWMSRTAAVDNSSGDTTSGTQTQAPSRSPDAEARLRRLLPPGYAPDSCNPVAPTSGALAAIECSANGDPGGPPTANYLLMANTESLRSTFEGIVKDTSVLNCPGNIQSPGAWHRNATPQIPSGTVLCGTQQGMSIVAWTTDAQALVSVARSAPGGPTLDQLYAWWTMHS